jgi:hypothetical protein
MTIIIININISFHEAMKYDIFESKSCEYPEINAVKDVVRKA